MIGQQENTAWGMYGGTYGSLSGSVSYRPQIDYWGLRNEIKRKDGPNFNYFELGPGEENSVYNRYGGPMGPHGPTRHGGGGYDHPDNPQHGGDRRGYEGQMNWGQMWTRRPGVEGKNRDEIAASH